MIMASNTGSSPGRVRLTLSFCPMKAEDKRTPASMSLVNLVKSRKRFKSDSEVESELFIEYIHSCSFVRQSSVLWSHT